MESTLFLCTSYFAALQLHGINHPNFFAFVTGKPHRIHENASFVYTYLA
ncbi:hypothetical protein [Desulfitobacterium dichloroeliminans]|nr:hypothetical protein [Desulfitobacterium dichloroeliminans]